MKTTHLTPAPKFSAGTQSLSPRWPALGSVLSHLALFLCLAALLAGAALVEHAAVSPHSVPASYATCHTTQVGLHGFDTPTVRCMDGQKGTVRTLPVSGKGPLAHLIYQDGCFDDDLLIYWNSNGNGPMLCINGSGVLNMTDFSYYGVSWNDQASAFWTGCFDVNFYVDINRGGRVAYAPGGPDGNYTVFSTFPYGGVGNDQLSSVWQFDSHGDGGDANGADVCGF